MTSRIPFLSSVLADEGMYCIVGLKKGAPRQTFVETVEEIDGVVDGLIAQGFDAYFGCAKYLNASEGRTAKNAKWFKAFWLDLDCGEGKPYETQSVALDALKQFVTDTGLPRPTIVNSGRGVHVYWILATPIFYNDWKPTAEAFKKFCAANGSSTLSSSSSSGPAPTIALNLSNVIGCELSITSTGAGGESL